VTDAPVRRTAIVLAVYIIVAWFVDDAAGWLRRVLALPTLFETLLRGGLWLGAPMAALLAWHYPSLGAGGGRVDSAEASEPSEPRDG
jgi:hypothetical protein